MAERPVTEGDSRHRNIEQMSTGQILAAIHQEDRTVAEQVGRRLTEIGRLVDCTIERMREGGRLFYLGAGTSGRLGVLDASECPPTFGIPPERVVGLIAGGDRALRSAVEFAEDDEWQGWKDLQTHKVSAADMVLGISAGGTTPYVIGALRQCRLAGIATGLLCCNAQAPALSEVDFPVAVEVGPEFLTGSTRMKSGTAQKMVLNMISTAVMARLGRVEGHRMIYLQLSNRKLIDRGVRMVMEALKINDPDQAAALLRQAGSVKEALRTGREKK